MNLFTEITKRMAISLRHILASPGYAPGTIAVDFTWMKRGFNACQKHRSMYPSIFNRFQVIQTRKFKSSSFQHIFVSPGYAAETIAVNVIQRKRIQLLENCNFQDRQTDRQTNKRTRASTHAERSSESALVINAIYII